MEPIIYELANEEELPTMTSLRGWLSNKHRTRLDEVLQEATRTDLKQSALVFAPHQDDETLGCGGTILRKRALDMDVDIVFLTDGHTSHRHLMSPLLLAALREDEAVAACEKLNVAADHVTFLRFPDGSLKETSDAAASKILQLLREKKPSEIYIPYIRDPQPDHVATNRLVRTVLRASGMNATILEYPVWAWYQWPMVALPPMRPSRNIRQVLTNTVKLQAGLRLVRDMNYRVDISDVRAQKRSALDEHRTQMTRIDDDPNWLTLHDVANGDWLDCFLQRNEVFCRYNV